MPQNSSTAGSINPGGDDDYFRIDLVTGETLTVETTGSTDTYGYLLGADGTTVLGTDDDSGAGIGTNFLISRTLSAGIYYVRVRHYSSSGTGAYTLVSTFSAVTPVYTVAPSADSGGSVSPGSVQTVNAGATSAFTVTATNGYTRSGTVGGTCPAGSWSGNAWTTGAIVANCTVSFSFTLTGFCQGCLPNRGGWRAILNQ